MPASFSFLPFVLLDTDLDARRVWALASVAQAIWPIAIPFDRRRQAARVDTRFESSRVAFLTRYTPIGLLLWNAAGRGESRPCVVGILVLLYVVFMTFVGSMLDSLRSES